MNFYDLIKQQNLGSLLLSGNFGLEKENVRTDLAGNIALTPHPEAFGDRRSTRISPPILPKHKLKWSRQFLTRPKKRLILLRRCMILFHWN